MLSFSFPGNFSCTDFSPSLISEGAVIAMRVVLVVPLYALVLRVAFRRWKQRRGVLREASHSDAFTYHMGAMEVNWLLGALLFTGGVFTCCFPLVQAGLCLTQVLHYGETLFLLLMCLEWYVATVHPVTYRGLGQSAGVRRRKALTAGVWLATVALIGLSLMIPEEHKAVPLLCELGLAVLVVSFCSIAVLRALTEPQPGERARGAARGHQSKHRAVLSVAVISAVIGIWFCDIIVIGVLRRSRPALDTNPVWVNLVIGLVCMPSSAVSPLLYLNRAGKVRCCSHSSH